MTDDGSVPGIYLITPPLADAAVFAETLDAVLSEAEAACLLLEFDPRALAEAKKIARTLTPMAQGRGTAVLVRDSALAAHVGADGAHLSAGFEDFEAALDRAIASLKPKRIVGAGGLRSKHAAMTAGERDVDYVMFGDPELGAEPPPLEATIERVTWWAEIFTTPCVAYAARLEDAGVLMDAGADFIAFSGALWGDLRGPRRALAETVRDLRRQRKHAP